MAKYGINQKGNRTLLDRDNYSYNLEKKVNGTEFWRCSKFKKGCKSRAISRPSSNNILNVTIHDHSNNLINSEARKAEKEAIRLAGQNPSVEVYDTVILEYLEENADLWPDWSDEIRQFVAYMDRTWIGNPPLTRNGRRRNPLFSFDLWNKWSEVQGNLPTTNNSNEAYNNQWNRTTEANATMWTIIYNFQREDALSRKTV